jgi:hypothetical protein
MTDEIKITTPKYLRRARERLAVRVASHNETCRTRTDNGKGFHKPGQMKLKK